MLVSPHAGHSFARIWYSVTSGGGGGAALTGPTLPDLTSQLMRDRVPHLALRTAEAIGVVGPLVRPGSSACLNCVDMRKTEADPQWPKILAQATFARPRPQACDTVLAAMTATLASAQALAYLDRPGTVPVTADGTLEVVLPDWQWRRRTWLPHPACGCGAFAALTRTIRSWPCGTMSE